MQLHGECCHEWRSKENAAARVAALRREWGKKKSCVSAEVGKAQVDKTNLKTE
jgi:hypothetical protein